MLAFWDKTRWACKEITAEDHFIHIQKLILEALSTKISEFKLFEVYSLKLTFKC